MNFKTISFVVCLVLLGLQTGWSQRNAISPKVESSQQVMRNSEQTYVHLQWMPTKEATSYEVRIRNLSAPGWDYYTTDQTNLTVPYLTVPASYEWTVVPLGKQVAADASYETKMFSTEYKLSQKVDKEIFKLLMGWDGTNEEKMTLGQYLRKNKTDRVSSAKLETFIQNYYNGKEPEKTDDELCQCNVFLQDNFIPDPSDNFPPITEASYIRYGTADGTGGREKLGSNKYHQRKLESNYIVSYGAAKDMSFNLEGRMNDGQWQRHYTEEKTDQTFIVAKFVCSGSDCEGCRDPQRFDVWAKYIIDMQFTEWLAGPGEFGMSSQDAALFMEVSESGVVNLGEKLTGIMREKDVSLNPDNLTNWLNAFNVAGNLADQIFNFTGTNDDTNVGQAILQGINGLVESWATAINTPTYVTNVNSGIDVTSEEALWKHQTCIAPNEWKCFAVVSTGILGYDEAWGKKGIAINGWKNVDPDIKISGYQKSDIGMSISSVYQPYPQPGECANGCCFNSMGKWLYYSMRGNDFDVRGEIRGLFDDIGWEYADDFVHFDDPPTVGDPVDFYQGNAVLETNFALITTPADCCVADPINMDLDIRVDCVKIDCGPGGPGDDVPHDDTSDNFIPDPPNPGDPCYKFNFVIQVLCDLYLNHIIQIFRFHPDTGNTLEWSNYAGQSPTGQYIVNVSPYYPESFYYVSHKVVNSCGELVTETFNVTIDCADSDGDGGGDGGDGGGDYPTDGGGDFLSNAGKTTTTTAEQATSELTKNTPDLIQIDAQSNLYGTLEFEVFPNPATDVLNVRLTEDYLTENASIEIYDVNGRLVKTVNLTAGEQLQQLPVDGMISGMYLLRLHNGLGKTSVKRVIIK